MRLRDKKMSYLLIFAVFYLFFNSVKAKTIVNSTTETTATTVEDNFDNNIINFEEDFTDKYNKRYGAIPWHSTEKFNKDSLKYTVIKNRKEKNNEINIKENKKYNESQIKNEDAASRIVAETTPVIDYSVIPLELISTTENILVRILDSTTEPDLTVIPLSTTEKISEIEIEQTVTLPVSTQSTDITTEYITTENDDKITTISENHETTTSKREVNTEIVVDAPIFVENVPKLNQTEEIEDITETLVNHSTVDLNLQGNNTSNTTSMIDSSTFKITTEISYQNATNQKEEYKKSIKEESINQTLERNINNVTKLQEVLKTNSSKQIKNETEDFDSSEFLEDVPLFSELDIEEEDDVPEDYYDAKDVVPTTVPKTDALSVIFGLAGSVVESVVESVAERVVPKGLYDLFKRMQRQNEALEAERLRSREENGGIGQFTRGILKSLSSGLSKPLSQLMAGVKDIGSLDTDRGFVNSLASGVTSVASSVATVADAFKDKVQAIYPGTVWCGDGHSAAARSGDLGLFFFTDTCCRQHDACKIFIKAGETKYGLTNTGLFTRSHCSCDAKFRDCLHRTNSLVSAQIGLTYFNVLGPQCFRKAHPIVKCVRRTRITGQKCEEYELDFTKPKMWQWFDNETF